MPSLKEAMSSIDPERLLKEMDDRNSRILIVDCRPASEFRRGRIEGSVNVTLPASVIMLRRLANGKLSVPSLIKSGRDKFGQRCRTHVIVLYDRDSRAVRQSGPCILSTLYRRFQQDGCQVVCLEGGFQAFVECAPGRVEIESPDSDDSDELTLENLRIAAPSVEGDRGSCDSGLERGSSPGSDPPFPVEILPYLFLGDADNSADREALARHNIRYVLNVTPNLPNTFEKASIRYMQIPIQDHWSQNLATFFPEAIAFIDEARQKREGVLVHCLAGVSRSVTITLAYLMQKLSMPLNDAYDFVRQRKANISPNLNFMGQLMDFERQLKLAPCICRERPCRCHFISPTRTTPDSGIDLDHWT